MDIAEIIRAAVTYGAPALTAKRLFGPSVDVVANRLANSTEWMIDNAKAVLTNAAKKTNDDEEGEIPPRVTAAVLDEAVYAEDELMREYFGGVLASARTPNGRDDTATVWARRLAQLSTYSIRLHYGLYASAHRALREVDINLARGGVDMIVSGGTVLTFGQVYRILDPGGNEEFEPILRHAFTSLVAIGLLSESSAYGPGESVMRTAKSAGSLPGDALVMYPSENGMELFFAAHGFSQIMAPLAFGRPECELDEIDLSVEEGISTDRLRKMTQLERDEWFIAHS